MTKITPEIIDDLILDQHFAEVLKDKSPVFTLLMFATLAEYQKALEDQSVTGNAPVAESEPESETGFEPGLCPVAEQVAVLTEQVATLTEKLDCAMHHIADMDELVEVHQDILDRLANITEVQTDSIASVIEFAHAAMRGVSGDTGRTAAPGMGTPMDVKQILAYILGDLPKATK